MPTILNPSQHFSSVCFAAHFMVFKSEVEWYSITEMKQSDVNGLYQCQKKGIYQASVKGRKGKWALSLSVNAALNTCFSPSHLCIFFIVSFFIFNFTAKAQIQLCMYFGHPPRPPRKCQHLRLRWSGLVSIVCWNHGGTARAVAPRRGSRCVRACIMRTVGICNFLLLSHHAAPCTWKSGWQSVSVRGVERIYERAMKWTRDLANVRAHGCVGKQVKHDPSFPHLHNPVPPHASE